MEKVQKSKENEKTVISLSKRKNRRNVQAIYMILTTKMKLF